MKQEKVRLLAATGTAEHRTAQVGTANRNSKGNTCHTVIRLFRMGTNPRKEVKRKKSGETITFCKRKHCLPALLDSGAATC